MPRDRLILVAIAGLTGVIVLLLLLLVLSQRQEAPINLAAIQDESQPFPIVGREHIPVGVPPTRYNSDPPTSGDHYAAPVRAGFYEQRLPERLPHPQPRARADLALLARPGRPRGRRDLPAPA